MMFNRWPSLLLSIALLIGVAVLFKRFDFLLVNEVKALVSVVFGFASSCILLSLIWLLQRKPLQETWTNQALGPFDAPNMNPRASLDSVEQQRVLTIHTVSSSNNDHPPKYEDALINSKPINWIYLGQEKPNQNEEVSSGSNSANQLNTSLHLCMKHANNPSRLSDNNQTIHLPPSRECTICMNEMISNKNSSSGTSMAQIALNIVKGFTSLETINNHYSNDRNRMSLEVESRSNNQERRKTLCQLDVNQLLNCSGSPPKYWELSFGGLSNEELSNSSNEPRAGSEENISRVIA